MRLVDLDAKEPYLLDGRYSVGILDNVLTVERPQGKWIESTQGFYCSLCYEYDYTYYDHKFCPYCGAEIIGEERW